MVRPVCALLCGSLGSDQVMCGVHKSHMRKGLWEVAQLPLPARVVFLGKQSHIVAQGQQALEKGRRTG